MICTTRAANVQVGPFVHNAGAGAVMQAGPHEALSRDVGEHDFGSLIKEGSGLILSEIGASTPHRHYLHITHLYQRTTSYVCQPLWAYANPITSVCFASQCCPLYKECLPLLQRTFPMLSMM
jgi:hypothetical protein